MKKNNQKGSHDNKDDLEESKKFKFSLLKILEFEFDNFTKNEIIQIIFYCVILIIALTASWSILNWTF